MILVAVFIGGYYYLSYLVIGKKYAIYDKEGRIRLTTMKYNSSSKLRSYFKKEYQTFFRNPVYVINGCLGFSLPPFYCRCLSGAAATAESIEQIRTLVSAPEFSFYAVLFAIAVIVLTSTINVVASSSFSERGQFLDSEDYSVSIKAASVREGPVFYKYFNDRDYHKLLHI